MLFQLLEGVLPVVPFLLPLSEEVEQSHEALRRDEKHVRRFIEQERLHPPIKPQDLMEERLVQEHNLQHKEFLDFGWQQLLENLNQTCKYTSSFLSDSVIQQHPRLPVLPAHTWLHSISPTASLLALTFPSGYHQTVSSCALAL